MGLLVFYLFTLIRRLWLYLMRFQSLFLFFCLFGSEHYAGFWSFSDFFWELRPVSEQAGQVDFLCCFNFFYFFFSLIFFYCWAFFLLIISIFLSLVLKVLNICVLAKLERNTSGVLEWLIVLTCTCTLYQYCNNRVIHVYAGVGHTDLL